MYLQKQSQEMAKNTLTMLVNWFEQMSLGLTGVRLQTYIQFLVIWFRINKSDDTTNKTVSEIIVWAKIDEWPSENLI